MSSQVEDINMDFFFFTVQSESGENSNSGVIR